MFIIPSLLTAISISIAGCCSLLGLFLPEIILIKKKVFLEFCNIKEIKA